MLIVLFCVVCVLIRYLCASALSRGYCRKHDGTVCLFTVRCWQGYSVARLQNNGRDFVCDLCRGYLLTLGWRDRVCGVSARKLFFAGWRAVLHGLFFLFNFHC